MRTFKSFDAIVAYLNQLEDCPVDIEMVLVGDHWVLWVDGEPVR